MIPIFATAALLIATPTDRPAVDFDLSCAQAGVYLIANGRPDQGEREAGRSMLFFYVGRLSGRQPLVDWSVRVWKNPSDVNVARIEETGSACVEVMINKTKPPAGLK